MNIKEKLNLLAIAKNKFEIKDVVKNDGTQTYEVLHLQADLAACITVINQGSNISVSYFRTDCYNSGTE